MAQWKKMAAGMAAAAMLGSLAGCGSSTAYALTIDGEQVKAGVYIYYSYVAYNDAISTLTSQNEELDTTDDKLVKEQVIDGKDTLTWIQEKAKTYCEEQVTVNHHFEEVGLELSEEELSDLDSTVEQIWETSGEVFERNGISESSVREVMEYTYKASDLFLYYYDIDGEEGIQEQEVYDYYVENHARVQYVRFNLVDGNGEELDDAGKKEIEKMANDYLAAVQKLEQDETVIGAEMDSIQEEYNAYVTSISEEAVAATATSETDENGNEIPATTTTTTTTVETTTTTSAPEESESETDAEGTTVASEAESEEDTEAETTTTTAAADEDSEETTTTTVPYANETIIVKATTDDDTKEEDITYSPSKTVHDYVYEDAKINVPELIYDEDSNAYFLIVRYDIENRMTEDDLWTDSAKTNMVSEKFSDSFQEKLTAWCDEMDVQTNEAAIKRYDPFEIDFSTQ